MRTFTFTADKSVLEAHYFPPIYLNSDRKYEIAFISFESFNSIPNVDKENNMFYITDFPAIEIPIGNYEFDDIADFINTHINENEDKYNDVSIVLKSNHNTLHSIIKCSHEIDFIKPNNIGKLLGFKPRKITANHYVESDFTVNIFSVNVIRIECNIAHGAYNNNEMVHTLHEFFPHVPPGFKIIEAPQNLIYLPVATNIIDFIRIQILDQDGKLVNFNSETVTIRLHLRESKNGY